MGAEVESGLIQGELVNGDANTARLAGGCGWVGEMSISSLSIEEYMNLQQNILFSYQNFFFFCVAQKQVNLAS